jgi:hypothetical protein
MCANLFNWLTGSATILCLVLYLWELWKRTNQGKLMLGFLHGAKSLVEAMSQRNASTGADWQPLLVQINNMLAYLQPPKKK